MVGNPDVGVRFVVDVRTEFAKMDVINMLPDGTKDTVEMLLRHQDLHNLMDALGKEWYKLDPNTERPPWTVVI